jgi:hypothetical protein
MAVQTVPRNGCTERKTELDIQFSISSSSLKIITFWNAILYISSSDIGMRPTLLGPLDRCNHLVIVASPIKWTRIAFLLLPCGGGRVNVQHSASFNQNKIRLD